MIRPRNVVTRLRAFSDVWVAYEFTSREVPVRGTHRGHRVFMMKLAKRTRLNLKRWSAKR